MQGVQDYLKFIKRGYGRMYTWPRLIFETVV